MSTNSRVGFVIGCTIGVGIPLAIAIYSSNQYTHTIPNSHTRLSLLSHLTLSNLIWSTLTLLSLRFYYCCFWRPLSYNHYLSPTAKSEALTRSYADLPPPYPNSWFKLCDSFLLGMDEEKQISAFGDIITLTRTQVSTSVSVVGSMEEESVLHCVDSEGNSYHVTEKNQMIFIWYDERDGAKPTWEVPVAADGIHKRNWRFHGKVTHEISCHIGEIAENGADTAHLNFVHGGFITHELLGLDRILPGMFKHTWAATWTPQSGANSHIAQMNLQTGISFYDYIIPMITVDSNISQIGPGIVQLLFPTPFGKILVQETITPLATNLQRAENVVWAEKTVPRFMAKFILNALTIQFERDIPIWNNKRWVRAPMAVKEDGPILKYRRWTKQFYCHEGGKVVRDAEGRETYQKRQRKLPGIEAGVEELVANDM